MVVQLTETQTNLIEDIAQKEGLTDFEIVAEPGTIKGDNYLGVITTVSLKNGEKKLDLLLKSAVANEKLRQAVPVRSLYLREIYLYEKVFIEFVKFQKEYGLLDGFSAYAKIYGSRSDEPNECLVFENLREIGYSMWDRRLPMNSEHISLVFTEYGKLHALSLALNDKNPELFKKLKSNLVNVFDTDDDEKRVESVRPVLENGSKLFADNPLASEAFRRYTEALEKSLREDLGSPVDKIVITHGDCWCNNLMFKYEDPQDSTKPTTVCILDWQISSIGSPVMDLAYFFFVCSPKEILYDYKKYLKIYYDSVCKTLKGLSCDPETVFPYSLLEYHWNKYAKYGLYVAIMLIKLMVGNSDEVPDMTEIAESGKSLVDGFSFETVHDEDYKQRITDIVIMMSDTGLI